MSGKSLPSLDICGWITSLPAVGPRSQSLFLHQLTALNSMNKPFKPEYSNISWSYDKSQFAAWSAGRTGYPIVDAAMRQLNEMGWMHNRCRKIVSSTEILHPTSADGVSPHQSAWTPSPISASSTLSSSASVSIRMASTSADGFRNCVGCGEVRSTTPMG